MTRCPPADLVGTVIRRHRRHVGLVADPVVLALAAAAVPAAVAAGQAQRSGAASSGHSQSPGPAPFRHLPSRFRGLPMPASDLPWQKNGYNLTRALGGWVAEPYPGAPACCAGPAVPLYFIADNARVATRIGMGYSASAAEQTSAVWVTTYPGRKTRIGTARATVREFTVRGAALGPAARLPAGVLPRSRGRVRPLAEQGASGPVPVVDKLWDPVTGRVVRDVTGVNGASDSQIAWQSSLHCGRCVLRLANELTGASVTVALPRNTRAFGGTFSADGRLLAIAMSTSATPGGEVTRARLGVIDTTSGRLTVLPGTSVRAVTEDLLTFGWRAGSHRVARLVPPPGLWPVTGESG